MDDILGIEDEESARAVREIFNGLGLPVPQRGEYSERSSGMGGLVFVSRYGFVVRVVPAGKTVDISSSCLIKPLFDRAAGGNRFVVDPGYDQRTVTLDDAAFLKQKARGQGLDLRDLTEFNIARVPGTDHLVLVDIDPSFISRRRESSFVTAVKATGAALRAVLGAGREGRRALEPDLDPQIRQYDPLRTILAQAWPENASVPDPQGIADFKAACLDFKAEGKLRADWAHSERYPSYWMDAPMYLCDLQVPVRAYAARVLAYENTQNPALRYG